MLAEDIVLNITNELDDVDPTVTAKVWRYINRINREIINSKSWFFRYGKTYLQLEAPYSTGTVMATNDSPTITGSGTSWTSTMVGKRIEIDGSQSYYTIKTVVSATEITLDQNYFESSESSLSYNIYKESYSLDSLCGKVINIVNTNLNKRLEPITNQEFANIIPNSIVFGSPTYYIDNGLDTNGYMSVQFYDVPDDNYILYYTFRKKTGTLVKGSTSIIPEEYHDLLYLGGLALAYENTEDTRSGVIWAQYQNLYDIMEENLMSKSEDDILKLNAWNANYTGPNLKLPPDHFRN